MSLQRRLGDDVDPPESEINQWLSKKQSSG
jgi:hypothetical protein